MEAYTNRPASTLNLHQHESLMVWSNYLPEYKSPTKSTKRDTLELTLIQSSERKDHFAVLRIVRNQHVGDKHKVELTSKTR